MSQKVILQLSVLTPYTDPITSAPHFLDHGHWCHLAYKLKAYCDQAHRRNCPRLLWRNDTSCSKSVWKSE